MKLGTLTTLVLFVSCCLGRADDEAKKTEPLSARDKVTIRSFVQSFRTGRTGVATRMKAIARFTQMGPAAQEVLEEEFRREIKRCGERAGSPPPTKVFDEKIEPLQKKLAELRQRADLSEDILRREGLPALDALLKLTALREAQLLVHDKRLSPARGELAKMTAVFRELKEEATEGQAPPLPVDALLKEIDAILEKATDADWQAVRELRAKNGELTGKLDPQERQGLRLMNNMRIALGLKPCLVDLKLSDAARGHAADMRRLGFFSQESSVPGKKTPADRARKAGTQGSAENIYHGSMLAETALKVWFLSPGHHKNMFNRWSTQGLGRDGDHWTQMFAR